MKYIFLSFCCILLNACAPAKILPMEKYDPDRHSTLKLYRPSAFNSGAVGLVVGLDQSDRVKLPMKSYAVLHVSPGEHELYVRSDQGDQPFTITIVTKEDETQCFKAHPNKKNLAKALVPITFLGGHTFKLEKINCEDFNFEELTKKNVNYVE